MRIKKSYIVYAIIPALVIIGGIFLLLQKGRSPLQLSYMDIASVEFENNESIPSKFTCQGDGINPELKISGVPSNAKSLVLIVDDPDAPIGTFTHWVVWNIDPKISIIKENSIPGTEGSNSIGKTGYIGPCPPSGTHRYLFKLYALDSMLDLHTGADKSQLEAEVARHELARAELVGTYQKN